MCLSTRKRLNPITPCLWFNGRAEEAVEFYTGIFKNSKKLTITHYGKNMHLPEGEVLVATFELDGQEIMILNGGPYQKLTPAFSLSVSCEDQAEVDYFWDKLVEGGAREPVRLADGQVRRVLANRPQADGEVDA